MKTKYQIEKDIHIVYKLLYAQLSQYKKDGDIECYGLNKLPRHSDGKPCTLIRVSVDKIPLFDYIPETQELIYRLTEEFLKAENGKIVKLIQKLNYTSVKYKRVGKDRSVKLPYELFEKVKTLRNFCKGGYGLHHELTPSNNIFEAQPQYTQPPALDWVGKETAWYIN